jgi:hypothetical protein
MSTERAWVLQLRATDSLLDLTADIRSAAARAAKAECGDRLDLARFEALVSRLEQAALNDESAPRIEVAVPEGYADTLIVGMEPAGWPEALPADVRAAAQVCAGQGSLPVLVIDPFTPGATSAGARAEVEEPAQRWPGERGAFGRRAVEARFRAQIGEALAANGRRRIPITPSGIQNAVVTEILREFVTEAPGSSRVDAPVEYRDGSRSAHPFPLRALPLTTTLPDASLTLRFALLSIRHTEMDVVVDGAWLRNAEISRSRPAGQTDDLVFETSLQQLDALCRGERHVCLYLYQTGLETAVVGFYRAVTAYLLDHPSALSVQPMFFQAPPKPRDPKPRNRKSRSPTSRWSDDRRATGWPTAGSVFREGTPWAM